MGQALGAVLVGVLIAAAGFVLRGSATPSLQAVSEVLLYGGVIVAVVGAWLGISRYLQTRDE
ncbi:hypothetical protein L2K70_01980 [Nocardioides KLBMP 9356]|uniref:Uncharacterized protein n=1 Tax=Nocardioides potassii TaxID=2911371 RepID=A0ABS9H524_9ACTN|nr:hypothetical protein [Nocardioides potassii]MCF6376365.1 hypothetical protein [Nocardioides potassii]